MKLDVSWFKKTTKPSIQKNYRQRKLNRKLKKQKAKKLASKRKKIPSSWSIAKQSFLLIKNNYLFFTVMMAVFLILNIILASGISNISTSIETLKNTVSDLEASDYHGIQNASISFLQLVGTSGSSGSSTASTLQLILIIIQSLVIIWSIRQLKSKVKISVKEAYYSSTAQLVPFILVIAIMTVQLLPLMLSSSIYNSTITNGLAISTEEKIGFILICIGLAAWSLRMIGSSVFGLYIVTLPHLKPIQSLQKAKVLVRFRRLMIIRKMIMLPIVILALMAIIILPLIIYATSFAAPVFYVLSAFALLYTHIYLYSLYRWMIK